MKAVVAAFNQEKALVGAFSVITNLRLELFQALAWGRFIGSKLAGCRPVSDSVPAGCSVEETAQQIVPLGRGS